MRWGERNKNNIVTLHPRSFEIYIDLMCHELIIDQHKPLHCTSCSLHICTHSAATFLLLFPFLLHSIGEGEQTLGLLHVHGSLLQQLLLILFQLGSLLLLVVQQEKKVSGLVTLL